MNGWSSDIDTITVKAQNIIVKDIQSNYSDKIDRKIELLMNEYNNYISRVDMERNIFYVVIGLLFAILSIFLTLRQNYMIKKQAEKINLKMAKMANIDDPKAFREAIKAKSVEIELMKDYPITIVYDIQKSSNCIKEMEKLLTAYGFKNVEPISFNEVNKILNEKHILIFLKDSYDESLAKQIKCSKKNLTLGFRFNKENQANIKIDNHANSFSTLYNNLMSLLHYKRYIDSYNGN
jgi:tetrahydromethanopterin S-methyltransferase subunit G